jgi:hypothetical protein
MLPGEVVEELIGGLRATGFHVLATLANALNGFLVVLTFAFEIVGQNIIKRVCSAPSAAPGEFLQLRQPLGLDRHSIHDCNSIPGAGLLAAMKNSAVGREAQDRQTREGVGEAAPVSRQ